MQMERIAILHQSKGQKHSRRTLQLTITRMPSFPLLIRHMIRVVPVAFTVDFAVLDQLGDDGLVNLVLVGRPGLRPPAASADADVSDLS